MKNPDTWICPFCFERCAFGKMGCDDPDICENPKNIVYELSRKHRAILNKPAEIKDQKGIGISEIANAEE